MGKQFSFNFNGTALCSLKSRQKKCGSGPWCVSQPPFQTGSSERVAQGVCGQVKGKN